MHGMCRAMRQYCNHEMFSGLLLSAIVYVFVLDGPATLRSARMVVVCTVRHQRERGVARYCVLARDSANL